MCAGLVCVSAGGAVAAGPRWIGWHQEAHFNQGLSGIACAGASLCVASGGGGGVAVSTDPIARDAKWTLVQVDSDNALSGVACPTARWCAAIDRNGTVLVSTRPAGGPGTWAAASAPTGIRNLSCPTVTFCAASNALYVYATGTPGAGASSWSTATGGDEGPECGKYGDNTDCASGGELVSCPTANFCSAGDGYGRGASSTDPLDGQNAWEGSAPEIGEYDTLSCASESLCVASCPPGYGFNGAECNGGTYGAGTIVAWDPLDWQGVSLPSVRFTSITAQPLTGVWCQLMTTLCFATDGNELYGAIHPTGGISAWQIADPLGSVTGVACPSPTRCVATSGNRIFAGSPPPNSQQVMAVLERTVAAERSASPASLLRDDGRSFVFNAPAAGKLTIFWRLQHRLTGTKGTLIATLKHRYSSPASRNVQLKLTRLGRLVLSTHTHITVDVHASYADPWLKERFGGQLVI